jgi:glutamate synthase domain-containing protein 1
MPEEQKSYYTQLRMIYGSALLNGPFSIVVGSSKVLMGLNDRIKLRPMIAARANGTLYLSSEESAIHEARDFQPLEKIWTPRGGELTIGRLKNGNE